MQKKLLCLALALCMLLTLAPRVPVTASAAAPEDAVQFGGSCYKIYNTSMTWTEARDYCANLGGRLVTITSQEESDFLVQQLASAEKNCYWIGVSYQMDEGKWELVNGSAVPFFNWAPNEPNFFENNEENYVHLFGKRYTGGKGTKEIGMWNDVTNEGAAYASDFYALSNFGFICEWGEETVTSIDDLAEFNGHYYKLYHHTASWEDARDYCTSLGGHLATITSQEENDFLYDFITSRSVTNAYFGLTDSAQEGTWTWVTGESLDYTNWGGSEPNAERDNEDYGMFYYKYTDGRWNDGNFGQGTVGDGYPVYFLCEWDHEPTGDDLILKNYPTGYDFLEDSYSFDNAGASVWRISKKYFTTMFEPAAGKLLYDDYKDMGSGGVCFGMSYTTAAIYNGYPAADTFVTGHLFSEDEACEIIRDLTLKSKTKIGDHEISLHDYIKYAHVYQLGSAVSRSSQQNWDDVAGLRTAVRTSLENDQVGVTIGMTHRTRDANGVWVADGGHRVLAVGIDGNDILIDDPNNTQDVERLTINDDGSWSYSGAWTSDGVNSTNSRIRYQTDITAPYHTLYTGVYAATAAGGSVSVASTEEETGETYIEGMEPLDGDKMLVSITSDGGSLENTDVYEVVLDGAATGSRMYWVGTDTTVCLTDLAGSENTVRLASDDLLLGASVTGGGNVSMTIEQGETSVILDAAQGEHCALTLNTTGEDGEDVVLTVSGTVEGGTVEGGTVILEQQDTGVAVTGITDGQVTLEEGETVISQEDLADSDDPITVDYDPDGGNEDVEILYESLRNPFHDVSEGAFYYDAVLWALEKGVTNGVTDSTFAPNREVTRAEVVTFLWRAAGEPEPASYESPFVDLNESAFYYKAVLWAAEQGITKGVDRTHFKPQDHCSRAQVVTFLHRLAGSPAPWFDIESFTDVPTDAYYADSVHWAVEQGITKGMTATTFGPDLVCSRGQIVTFLYRAFA